MDGLLALLHPDAVLTSDGGGIVNAARKPVAGAERVAKVVTALGRDAAMAFVDVNGMPGLAGHGRDGIHSIVAFTIDDGRITRIDFQRNPEKLR